MRISVLLLAVFSFGVAMGQQGATPHAYESDPAFQKVRADALQQERSSSGRVFAAGTWRKANKVAGGRCIECLENAAAADIRMGETKAAMQAARDMDAISETEVQHVRAELLLARAVLSGVNLKKPDTGQLQEAHAALEKAEKLALAAYFYDGRVLALLHKDEEAGEKFATYAQKTRTQDPLLVRAKHFTAHPELAREQMTPAVVLTTSTGRHFNLDEMNGRVVLIDFWATWCGPCKQELPHIKKLATQYANEPFELISISWDSDEAAWKKFIADNGMTWNQYRDADHSLTNNFGINAIPHYFTIDSNGVLTAENMGSGSNIDGRIKKLVEQARVQQRESLASATPLSPQGE